MTTRYTFRLDSKIPDVENRIVEISFDKGDEVTYPELLDQFKGFLMACGYEYLRGPLQFVEMEEEKTLERLARPERIRES